MKKNILYFIALIFCSVSGVGEIREVSLGCIIYHIISDFHVYPGHALKLVSDFQNNLILIYKDMLWVNDYVQVVTDNDETAIKKGGIKNSFVYSPVAHILPKKIEGEASRLPLAVDVGGRCFNIQFETRVWQFQYAGVYGETYIQPGATQLIYLVKAESKCNYLSRMTKQHAASIPVVSASEIEKTYTEKKDCIPSAVSVSAFEYQDQNPLPQPPFSPDQTEVPVEIQVMNSDSTETSSLASNSCSTEKTDSTHSAVNINNSEDQASSTLLKNSFSAGQPEVIVETDKVRLGTVGASPLVSPLASSSRSELRRRKKHENIPTDQSGPTIYEYYVHAKNNNIQNQKRASDTDTHLKKNRKRHKGSCQSEGAWHDHWDTATSKESKGNKKPLFLSDIGIQVEGVNFICDLNSETVAASKPPEDMQKKEPEVLSEVLPVISDKPTTSKVGKKSALQWKKVTEQGSLSHQEKARQQWKKNYFSATHQYTFSAKGWKKLAPGAVSRSLTRAEIDSSVSGSDFTQSYQDDDDIHKQKKNSTCEPTGASVAVLADDHKNGVPDRGTQKVELTESYAADNKTKVQDSVKKEHLIQESHPVIFVERNRPCLDYSGKAGGLSDYYCCAMLLSYCDCWGFSVFLEKILDDFESSVSNKGIDFFGKEVFLLKALTNLECLCAGINFLMDGKYFSALCRRVSDTDINVIENIRKKAGPELVARGGLALSAGNTLEVTDQPDGLSRLVCYPQFSSTKPPRIVPLKHHLKAKYTANVYSINGCESLTKEVRVRCRSKVEDIKKLIDIRQLLITKFIPSLKLRSKYLAPHHYWMLNNHGIDFYPLVYELIPSVDYAMELRPHLEKLRELHHCTTNFLRTYVTRTNIIGTLNQCWYTNLIALLMAHYILEQDIHLLLGGEEVTERNPSAGAKNAILISFCGAVAVKQVSGVSIKEMLPDDLYPVSENEKDRDKVVILLTPDLIHFRRVHSSDAWGKVINMLDE